LREAGPDIQALGARVVVVGTGAAYQAEHLMATGMPFPCLVDPEARLYEALRIGRVGVGHWLRPSVARRYAAAYRRGSRQGRVTGDWRRLSGVAVVEPDRTVRYLYRADSVGDYPPVSELLDALRG
jgi:AhpC/TSA antioxidant enzyme